MEGVLNVSLEIQIKYTEVCGTDLSVKELSRGTCIGVADSLQYNSGKDQETDVCWQHVVAEQLRTQLSIVDWCKLIVKCLHHALNDSKIPFDWNTWNYSKIICFWKNILKGKTKLTNCTRTIQNGPAFGKRLPWVLVPDAQQLDTLWNMDGQFIRCALWFRMGNVIVNKNGGAEHKKTLVLSIYVNTWPYTWINKK